ncbi:secondary thiamine-phosphate synthase enzyme YjbQ [candidate division KSB1 bacterium]
MKSLTEYLVFDTTKRIEFLNITDKVSELVRQSGVQEGLALVNPMHITAAVYVNDAESGIIHDYQEMLKRLVPVHPEKGEDYRHNRTGEDNAYAHMWRQLMAHQVVLAITNGSLDLGTWEQVYYAEFDGRRRKRVLVKIIGE